MKLGQARGATQDERVMVERSDRMWSIGEGNGMTLKDELLRLAGAQYATGDQ